MKNVWCACGAAFAVLIAAIGATALAQQPVVIGPVMTPVPALSVWSKLKPQQAVEWSGEALGLLRGAPDALAPNGWRLTNSLVSVIEYAGGGSAPDIGGNAVAVSADRAIFAVDFSIPAARLDFQTKRGRVVQVVANGRAWDEVSPGVGGRSRNNAAQQRADMIWLTPHGAVLGALWAGAAVTPSVERDRAVITYTREGRSVRIMLDEAMRPQRVEMRSHGHLYAAEYSGYKDFVGYSVICPSLMKQWIDGKVVMDLNVSYCAIGVYTSFPEPSANATAASTPAGETPKRGDNEKPFWEEEGKIENTEPALVAVIAADGSLYPGILRQNEPVRSDAMAKDWAAAKARPTPRIDGKPDFTGRWRAAPFLTPGAGGGPVGAKPPPGKQGLYWNSRGAALLTMENDGYLRRRGAKDKPLYKPDQWEVVRDLDLHALEHDDKYHCRALGVARLGAPSFVMQDKARIGLFNGTSNDSYLQQFRLIPFNQAPSTRVGDPTPQGLSAAHWDGDTLVIETTNMSDQTWLGSDGLLHSLDTRVIERLTRTGDTVEYDVTVEDPVVLVRPWVKAPIFYFIDAGPSLTVPDAQACQDVNSEFVPGAVH